MVCMPICVHLLSVSRDDRRCIIVATCSNGLGLARCLDGIINISAIASASEACVVVNICLVIGTVFHDNSQLGVPDIVNDLDSARNWAPLNSCLSHGVVTE